LVRLFVVLGFALLAGGAYAIFDGWPYRVLERGFTEVILGGLSAVAGLILLALSALLAEIRRLKGLVSGAMAAMALSEPRSAERPVAKRELADAEPVLEQAPAPEARSIGIATTLAAGAGAVAAAGALASLAKTEDGPLVKAADKADQADKAEEEGSADSDRPETAAEPSQAPSAAAGEIDDWLLPPVPSGRDVAPLDVHPDERGDSGAAENEPEDLQDEPERPIAAGIDAALDPAGDGQAPPEPAVAFVVEPEAKPADDEPGATTLAPGPVAEQDDQLWWPRIDHPAREQPGSVDDEFNALRDQLAGVVNAPGVEPPRRDRDTLDTVESWIAPRPWPPVTQPRDPGALSEGEPEAADKAAPVDAKAEPAPPEPNEPMAAEPEAARQEQAAREPASIPTEKPPAEQDGAAAAETRSDEEPAASDEGVIGAYQVGETQFTMFADGSIHARTPDGDYVFASMDELKAYLANEKDKLESRAS
jgi:hypothetical protein